MPTILVVVFIITLAYGGTQHVYDGNDRHMSHIVAAATSTSPTNSYRNKRIQPILYLDVDNTLYDDRKYHIEQQIIQSIHQFVLNHFDMLHLEDVFQQIRSSSSTTDESTDPLTPYQKAQLISDHMHVQHGSTIHGLVHHLRRLTSSSGGCIDANHSTTHTTDLQVTQFQKKFYDTVYHPNIIDYSNLLMPSSSLPHHDQTLQIKTGYGHQNSLPSITPPSTTNVEHNSHAEQSHDVRDAVPPPAPPPVPNENEFPILRKSLYGVSKQYRIQLASNSPIRHVQSIIQAMGLCALFTTVDEYEHPVVYTPDAIVTSTITELDNISNHHTYPTKLQPVEFFDKVSFGTRSCDPEDTTSSAVMIDDSDTICKIIQQSTVPIEMIHLNYKNGDDDGIPTLLHAICTVMGWIPQQRRHPPMSPLDNDNDDDDAEDDTSITETTSTPQNKPPYQFNDIQYLQHKNIVDLQSIHLPTYQQMLNEVVASYKESSKDLNCNHNMTSITIVDVGAGVLFMLKTLLGDGSDSCSSRLPTLIHHLQQQNYRNDGTTNNTSSSLPQQIHYYAYEPNEALFDLCHQQLIDLHFVLQTDDYLPPTMSTSSNPYHTNHQPIRVLMYQKSIVLSSVSSKSIVITVHLCFCDYRNVPTIYQQSKYVSPLSDAIIHTSKTLDVGVCTPVQCPNLIVGCCFADLFHDPNHLISSLLRWFGITPSDNNSDNNSDKGRLKHIIIYFPITFTGITSVYPPHPFETVTCEDGSQQHIPSDTLAFRYYANALTDDHNHNLDYHSIISSVKNYGGVSVGQGISNWIIHPHDNTYLWETMVYFFGTVAAPAVQNHGWYSRGWIQRLVHNKPTIRANNVDLLFRIPLLGEWKFPQQRPQIFDDGVQAGLDKTMYDEISFTGPFEVTCIKKERNVKLQPNQVLIKSEYSLISSGTELKIFQGKFDDDAILDTTIQDFNQEKMSYPLSYGYSLVGKVIDCGSNVADADELLGRRVFTFSAHASQVTTDRSNIHLVPDDIDPIDAIFMPSVETALSLVHDARPLIGENVAIFGQGLIGLLVTAVLNCQYDDNIVKMSHGTFGTVTTFDMIPDRLALSAQMGASQALLPSSIAGPFDVVLEVSGNRLALQKAIDSTCYAGRVIIGSWYGCDEISLKLGIDFHRSHKTIKASQVSEIPAELSKTWTKGRRFAMTWALLKQIRPSRLITLRTTINNAQMAYTALKNGTQIAVAFQY